MNRGIGCFVLILLFCVSLFAQKPMFSEPLSPRRANYKIAVQLDGELKRLNGSQILTWHNHSTDVIDHLQFHLYMNGFKNEKSTFMKESAGRHRRSKIARNGWGWIEVTKLIYKGDELSEKFEFIQPDDGNSNDQTVLKVPLDVPVQPDEVIELEMEFIVQLPEVFARTGYKGDFYMIGQWFPKIGVYEAAGERYATEGQWNCHQFHLYSEFFAAFGVYEVAISVPEHFIVGATGILIDETMNDDQSKTLTYYCEDVHDFAWTADPNYIVIEDQWRHVNIKFMAHPGREDQIERHIGAAKHALEFFDEWYGEYPYPTLTIVDPQYGARGAGGMEYPTLITSGTRWLMPAGLRWPEVTTIHEFGHNYWYAMVGSNEFEEAWLDEGITSYSETKVMDRFYGGDDQGSMVSLFGINIDNIHGQWPYYAARPKRDKIFKYAWQYQRGGYGTFSYDKPALMLFTLHNYLGEEKMKEVMRTYFERYRFKHPASRDFIETVNEVSAEDLNWFFDQVLYGTKVLDYKIDRISSRKISDHFRGVFGDPFAETDSLENDQDSIANLSAENDSSSQGEENLYENKVIVAREGEVIFPVEILVRFDDGSEVLEKWDGKDRYIVYEYQAKKRLISAEVDPDRKIWLDVNFLNNGQTSESNRAATSKYSLRWLFWMQNILQYLAILG